MPRTARASIGGVCYHVMNRGNKKAQVFHDGEDYQYFLSLITRASERVPMRVLAYCPMPTHFHLTLWPHGNGDLSRWMHWFLTAHVQYYRRRWSSTGHVWQGRFKAFPAQDDAHLLGVLRYVERNPLRANLVSNAQDWPWSSLYWCGKPFKPAFLCEGPLIRPKEWLAWVNTPQTEEEVAAIRRSADRNRPYGQSEWVIRTAKELGLESSLREPGRPQKKGAFRIFRSPDATSWNPVLL